MHRLRLNNFLGQATPPFLASVMIRRLLSVVPFPHATEHGDQADHSLTTQSVTSAEMRPRPLFNSTAGGWVDSASND